MRLSDAGEFGLLAELERRGLVHGIEHDVARLDGGRVATQDTLVEEVHFRLDWTSWHDLGYKAAAVNLSDLAAAGARPEALLVTLAAPPETAVDDIVELYAGLGEPRVPVVGGDTTASERVVLTVTALGHSDRVPGRAGARAGDVLVVTGPLGASAAGYLSLREGLRSPLTASHLRPPLRLDEGRRLAACAHAMLDLSDGLAADAGHIAERSGCAIAIALEQVPVAGGVGELAEAFGADVWELACGFGEDYELLAALAPEDAARFDFAAVGRCMAGSGVELLLAGEPRPRTGWDHFRPAGAPGEGP